MAYEREQLRADLRELQDLKYRDFHSKLLPGVDKETMIGIRTPVLRKFAKEFSKRKEAEEFPCSIYRALRNSWDLLFG